MSEKVINPAKKGVLLQIPKEIFSKIEMAIEFDKKEKGYKVSVTNFILLAIVESLKKYDKLAKNLKGLKPRSKAVGE